MHKHIIDPIFEECLICRATSEQVFKGELAHPGTPTSERIHKLVRQLFLMNRGISGN